VKQHRVQKNVGQYRTELKYLIQFSIRIFIFRISLTRNENIILVMPVDIIYYSGYCCYYYYY